MADLKIALQALQRAEKRAQAAHMREALSDAAYASLMARAHAEFGRKMGESGRAA